MGNKVTMKDIADRLGLSINSVSLALNHKKGVSQETRNLILNTAYEMEYLKDKPKYAKHFADKNICILMKSQYFSSSNFYSKVLLGVETEAKKYGYDVLINFADNSNAVPDCIIEGRISGIIVIGQISDEFLAEIKKYNCPLVLADHTSFSIQADSIVTNNRLGSYKITQYLIKNNYTRIGFFGDLSYSVSIKERFAGYQEGLRALNIFNSYDELIQYILPLSVLDNVEDAVIKQNVDEICKKIKQMSELPEVFVCSNDEAAIQLINALRQLGYRIPEDIGITGFDDIDIATKINPQLTTVRVSKEEMGKKAVERLQRQIQHQDNTEVVTALNVEVVIRDSIKIKRSVA
jgi:DNA-binding LacI/PurR family transcriptional regulator